MSIVIYGIIGVLFLGSCAVLIGMAIYKGFQQNLNWIPVVLTAMSIFVLWLGCGMPGMKAMTGYPFLFVYMLALASLVGVPILACIDILVIILKKNIGIWPYHLGALILAGVGMASFLIRQFNSRP